MKWRTDVSIAHTFLYSAGSHLYGDCQVTDNDKECDLVQLLEGPSK
ncbi:MAG TPA: hypothetical protein VE641_06645 [Chthoniobacterales bacterium]|nr:hypothetical protein [Chthoniobacterales bacterium]